MYELRDFLWTEKYRPRNINDTILPDVLKKSFTQYVEQQNVPNLLLCGTSGTGKTTVARAMLEQLGCDYYEINGSLSGNIETLRNEIKNFASTVSITSSGRKYVILDEADYLNPNSTQPALRNFMEEYSKNCGFILTCNYRSKIKEPIQSRCSIVEFKIPAKEKPALALKLLTRVCYILDEEKVPYEKAIVAELIKKHFPDARRIINELQAYAATGKIDTGILSNFTESHIAKLIEYLKKRDFTSTRKWIAENSDMDSVELYNNLYEKLANLLDPKTIPSLVLILAKYSYQSAFVANQEINNAACMAEIMGECTFK